MRSHEKLAVQSPHPIVFIPWCPYGASSRSLRLVQVVVFGVEILGKVTLDKPAVPGALKLQTRDT